jgi:hypothetical protein
VTPEEEDRADITLAFMLGMKIRATSTAPVGSIWLWDSDVPSGFGVCDTEAEASREFLNAYRAHHRTIKP